MKHNLPAPSQPWGNDINKRLASVENDLMLIRSTANNAAQSVTSLVSERATNGIAKPFYDEVGVSSPAEDEASVSTKISGTAPSPGQTPASSCN